MDGNALLCKNAATETREDFARTLEPHRRQSIKPTPRATSTRWVDGLPSTDKPSRRLEPKKYGIQGSGGEVATLAHVGTRKLIGGVLQKRLQDF